MSSSADRVPRRGEQEQLGERCLRLTDDRRRRLATKCQQLGRRLLGRVATIATPDAILRWHRKRIAAKSTFTSRDRGRPEVMQEIRALVVRFAKEYPTFGDS